MPTKYQFSDFDIDFNKNIFTNDVSIKKDRNSIQQSVKNIILTMPGEKPFNRSFGIGMHQLLFELFTPIEMAKWEQDTEWALTRSEPRVIVNGVSLLDGVYKPGDDLDANLVTMTIDYSIVAGSESNPIEDSLTIRLTKVR